MTDCQKFSEEFPTLREIQRWVAGYPDKEQLIAILSRSYDYIRKLPLNEISEKYRDVPDLYTPA